MEFEYLSPDGRLLSLAFEREWDLVSPGATVDVTAKLDGKTPDAFNGRRLTIAPAGNARHHIRDVLGGVITQTLRSGLGNLVLAAAPGPGARGVVAWQGEHFEVSSFTPFSVSISPKLSLRLLSGLEFRDSAAGLQIIPDTDAGERLDVISISFYIDGVGMVDVLNPGHALSVIPSWKGAAVPAGELWHFTPDLDDKNADYFLLGSESGALIVSPSQYPHQAALDFLGSVRSMTFS